jgi:hypothetical protein
MYSQGCGGSSPFFGTNDFDFGSPVQRLAARAFFAYIPRLLFACKVASSGIAPLASMIRNAEKRAAAPKGGHR